MNVARKCSVVAGLLLSFGLAGAGEPAAEFPATMTAEQRALAERMLAFVARTEERFFEQVRRFDRSPAVETRDFSYPEARHTVKVTRGKVIEKAGLYINEPLAAKPPFVPEPLWARYVEVNIHPATPHAGMLHATVYFSFAKSGPSLIAGYLDTVPGVWHDADNDRLKAAVESVYARHGQDIGRFRRQLCESEFGAKHHRDRLRASCVGTSLYDPPFLKPTAANLALVTEAFEAFVDTYLELLAERRRQRYTPADLKLRDDMRRRWLEDQLFADTFAMKVVPYEVWSMANLPPVVKF